VGRKTLLNPKSSTFSVSVACLYHQAAAQLLPMNGLILSLEM